jgi:hypothetical protein
MSGCGGDARDDTTINWVWYPWPPDAVALLERQWRDAIEVWLELAAHAERHGVERIAVELHPVGCRNSVVGVDRAICSEIVFMHPTGSATSTVAAPPSSGRSAG